ncbi:MAG: TerB family tellurite resistance protein [Planctomycetota bacterium]
MNEKPINLFDLFVQKASKHRICELRHELQSSDVAESCGEDELDFKEGVRSLVEKTRICALELLQRLEEHEPGEFGGSLSAVSDKAHELTDLMDEVRAKSESDLEESRVWRLLSSVVIEVADPHLRNLFLFKCAVLMARTDGELSSVESDFLHSLAEKIGLPARETQRIIREGSTIDVTEFHGNPEDALQTIHQLYLCALADGIVEGSEKRMLHRVASTLGVPESEVHDLLYGNQGQDGVDILDTKAVEDHLLTLSELPENVYLPKNMSADKMDTVREVLGVPTGETIFLIYENRFLGQLLESAALTSHSLWVSPPDEKTRRVEITDINDWHFGMRSTQIRLEDGNEIRFSRDARECFQLISGCLENALSPI